jgi:hypothetical protein
MTGLVTIAPRFNGPPDSANGGYACGVVAAAIGDAAQVDLRLPPPLAVPLERRRADDGTVQLLHGEALVAEGRPAAPAGDVPPPPSVADAAGAEERYVARRPEDHPFPTCFVCGSARGPDGLRLFAGPVRDERLLACTWRPGQDLAGADATDGTVDPVFVWSALDCPSAFACIPQRGRSVLASMTAAVQAPVHPGRTYVVSAWPLGSEGRKHRAGSAIHDSEGRRVAHAEALWITLREP